MSYSSNVRILRRSMMRMVLLVVLVVRVVLLVYRLIAQVDALVRGGVKTDKARRAVDLMHLKSNILVSIHQERLGEHMTYSVAIRGSGFRGSASGRINAEGGAVCIDGGDFATAGRCTSYAIYGINVALFHSMMVHRGHVVLNYSRVGGEKKSSKLWGSFTFMTIMFLDHMLNIFIVFYRNQGIKILGEYLILEDHIPMKYGAKLLH
ncbi:hypothetical protein CFOL_v3_06789 [Cephalotus follicularis]|uniref:Uncharacterized protein n=1 Tax=Cephalotus follicularis TaxID=3775 RepID=A0A1Q3B5R7_CEPFO|nr:hypothetical protein CFOL_v3_06789 [Cephalotus follicularis]